LPIKNIRKYSEIAYRIFRNIAALKKDYPHFAEIEPVEDKIQQDFSQFDIIFLYSYQMDYIENPRRKPFLKIPKKILVPINENGIYIYIRMFEKGTYTGQRVIPPVYFEDMQIIVDIVGGNDEIRDKIWGIINAENPEYDEI